MLGLQRFERDLIGAIAVACCCSLIAGCTSENERRSRADSLGGYSSVSGFTSFGGASTAAGDTGGASGATVSATGNGGASTQVLTSATLALTGGSPSTNTTATANDGIGGDQTTPPTSAAGGIPSSGGTSGLSGGTSATSTQISNAGGRSSVGGSSTAVSGAASTGGSAARVAKGVVQKGPFLAEATVIVQELDDQLSPTGQSTLIKTTDNLGHFETLSVIRSRYVEVIANGRYFDELANQSSSSPLTLRAIADLDTDTSVNVNLLTSLSASRERRLFATNASFAAARTQAEQEVLAALSLAVSPVAPFSELDLSRAGDDNGMLLAASLLLTQVARDENSASPTAQLSQLVARMANDIAANGVSGDTHTTEALRCVAPREVDLVSVRNNLATYLAALDSTCSVGDFERFMVAPSDCCKADTRRCAGSLVQVCNDTGSWLDDHVCDGGTPACKDGACQALCTAGDTRCSGTVAQTCDGNGIWQDNGNCHWSDVAIIQSMPSVQYGFDFVATSMNEGVTMAWQRSEETATGSRCFSIWAAQFSREASWHEPVRLLDCAGTPGGFVDGPRVAVSSAGEALVAWSEFDNGCRSRVSRLANMPGLQPTFETIISCEELDTVIGLQPEYVNDTPIVLWVAGKDAYQGTYWSASTADGSWLQPGVITTDEERPNGIQSASTRTGTVYLASDMSYTDGHSSVCVQSFTEATGWTAPHVLDTASPGVASTINIATNRSGKLVVLWAHDASMRSATYSDPDGWSSLGKLEDIAGATSGESFFLALDEYGNALSIEFHSMTDGRMKVFARHYSSLRGWGHPFPFDSTSVGDDLYVLDMGMDPTGNATVLWRRDAFPYEPTFGITRYSPTAGWGMPETIGTLGGELRLVVDSKGRLTIIWEAQNSTSGTFDIGALRYE